VVSTAPIGPSARSSTRPAPRKGLLALLDNKPLPDDLLKSIPKSATLVAAGGFDVSRLLAEVRSAVKSIDAEAAQNLEKGLSAGSMMVGTNLEKDLIDPLGPHWAAYCAPSVGGNGILGFTLINRLDDPARAERSLNAVELFANNMIVMQTRKQKGRAAHRLPPDEDRRGHRSLSARPVRRAVLGGEGAEPVRRPVPANRERRGGADVGREGFDPRQRDVHQSPRAAWR
jgi:hypothetical protein